MSEPVDNATLQAVISAQGGLLALILDVLMQNGLLSDELLSERVAAIYDLTAEESPLAAEILQRQIGDLRGKHRRSP